MRKRSSHDMTPHSDPEWGVTTPHSTLKSWQVWLLARPDLKVHAF